MQNDASATGNDHNLSIPNYLFSIYPPFDPYREPARSSSMQYQDPMNLSVQCLISGEVETLRLESETPRYVKLHNPAAASSGVGASEIRSLTRSSRIATAAGDDCNRSTVMKKAPFEDASSFLNSFDSGGGDKVAEDESPTGVMEPVTFPLPKSISARSRGYLKMSQAPAAASSGVGAGEISSLTRSSRIASPLNASYSEGPGGYAADNFLVGSSFDRDYEALMRAVGEWHEVVGVTRNWIQEGIIVPTIRNQYTMNACWAFTVVTGLEYIWKIKHPEKDQISFSAQQLIDCCVPDHTGLDNMSAYPYRLIDALAWIRENGVVTRERYPDDIMMGDCKCSQEMRYFQDMGNIVELSTTDQQKWIEVLEKHPILGSIWVDNSFWLLGPNEIYSGPQSSLHAQAHAVVIMGFDTYDGHEVIVFQNSYGDNWGSNGFGRLARDSTITKQLADCIYDGGLVYQNLAQLKSIHPNALPIPFLGEMRVITCPLLKELPLDSNSREGRKIVLLAEKEWWEAIEWEDDATKAALSSRFKCTLL